MSTTFTGLFRRIDIPSLAGALLMAYLALANEAWWTLRGTASSQILNINVSPFHLATEAVRLSPIPPFTALMGTITSILLFNAGMLLAASAFHPNAPWKPQARSLAFTSLAVALLSLTTLIHLARLAVSSAYGSNPPITGTTNLPGNILGLDLANYTNPPVTASFTLPFYLCLATLFLIGSPSIVSFLQSPIQRLTSSPLTRGLREIALTPLYQHQSQSLFQKIATKIQDAPRPRPAVHEETILETPKEAEPQQLQIEPAEKPSRAQPKTTRQERSILNTAIAIITGYQEPVQYRQLLNDAYMDLLDKNIEFKSARQIETTLLNHTGQELVLIDDSATDNTQPGQRWWLGEKTVAKGKGQLMDVWEKISENVKPSISKIHKAMTGWKRGRYKPRKQPEEED